MLIAYAKGARTFERHIDVEMDGVPVSPYCSLPHHIDEWFRAFKKAKAMCGTPGTQKRTPPDREIAYLDGLVRGVYAVRDLPQGHHLCDEDVYLAIPLQKGQISCRELMSSEVILRPIKKDAPIRIDDIESPYSQIPSLRQTIYSRGIDPTDSIVPIARRCRRSKVDAFFLNHHRPVQHRRMNGADILADNAHGNQLH